MKLYIAGRKHGSIRTYKNARADTDAVDIATGEAVKVLQFHKSPEEAIRAYKDLFPEEGEPDIVWEMTPREIRTEIALGDEVD